MQSLDITLEPRWGLGMALAWVGSRSPELVSKCRGARLNVVRNTLVLHHIDEAWKLAYSPHPSWERFEAAHWDAEKVGPPDPWAFTDAILHRPDEAEPDLLLALRSPQRGVQAWGMRERGEEAGRTVEITAVEWDTLKLGDMDTACSAFDVVEYRSVRVDRVALLKAFPPNLLAATPAQGGSTKPKTGRPPSYPWAAFLTQCEAVWQDRGGFMESDPEFSRQSHLVEIMGQWCADRPRQWHGGPGETLLKRKVKAFLTSKGH